MSIPMSFFSEVPGRFLLLAAIAQLLVACAPPDERGGDVDVSVLTLNLHTYQEVQTVGVDEAELTEELAAQRIRQYADIFDRIAAGIRTLDPDIICLQEVGEWAGDDRDRNATFGASDSNMVHQLLARLPDHEYEQAMDWSHFGYHVWREGSAILSKYPIHEIQSRYISRPENSHRDTWKSRNIPRARVKIPGVGLVDIFSIHMGWWDDEEEPFQEQFRRLQDWFRELDPLPIVLCGDFNVPAGGPGYTMITEGNRFEDAYLLGKPGGMYDATIVGDADGWEDIHRFFDWTIFIDSDVDDCIDRLKERNAVSGGSCLIVVVL